MDIGNKLKELRKLKKATQTEVADYLGIKQNTYSQYENDVRQPDIDTVAKLAMFFEVSIDELVGLKPSLAYNSELNAFVDAVFLDFRTNKKFDNMNDVELRKFILETAVEEVIKKLNIQ